jgi:hypothetical protein
MVMIVEVGEMKLVGGGVFLVLFICMRRFG